MFFYVCICSIDLTGDHRLSYSSLWVSNQQRALERKRLSEGNLLQRSSVRSDLALPMPLTHSTITSGPTARPLVSHGSLIQRSSHIPACLPSTEIPTVPHAPLHHSTTCNPCPTGAPPVVLRSLLRRSRSASMRSSVTFLDPASTKGTCDHLFMPE